MTVRRPLPIPPPYLGEGWVGDALLVKRISFFARDSRDLREKQDERDGEEFEVRSSRFSELRTPNFGSRLSRTSCLSRSRFTRKSSGSVIAAEALMNNAG